MTTTLKNKNIIFCVTGGIATYKAVNTVSLIIKEGAHVDVVMTENAIKFVSELTFQSISGEKVTTDMFGRPDNWDTKHISLAKKADLVVIAPATANIIGKIASGIADDFLTTMVMATKAKFYLYLP
jgi:phosphopantothenoylcysteine decarboxylase/phosphopantothenate--cysteine ligase